MFHSDKPVPPELCEDCFRVKKVGPNLRSLFRRFRNLLRDLSLLVQKFDARVPLRIHNELQTRPSFSVGELNQTVAVAPAAGIHAQLWTVLPQSLPFFILRRAVGHLLHSLPLLIELQAGNVGWIVGNREACPPPSVIISILKRNGLILFILIERQAPVRADLSVFLLTAKDQSAVLGSLVVIENQAWSTAARITKRFPTFLRAG